MTAANSRYHLLTDVFGKTGALDAPGTQGGDISNRILSNRSKVPLDELYLSAGHTLEDLVIR